MIQAERGKEEIKTKLEWEKKALQVLNEIPSYVRTMVVEMTEDIVQKEGVNKVTHDRFVSLIKEYAPKFPVPPVDPEFGRQEPSSEPTLPDFWFQ